MSQAVTIEINADEAKAVRAWLAVSRASDTVATSLGKIDAAQQKNASSGLAETRVRTEADRILKSLESDTEAYTRKVSILDQAMKTGHISADQHRNALSRLDATITDGNDGVEVRINKLALLKQGFLAAAAGASALAAANRESQKEADDAADTIEESRKRWATQTGLKGDALEQSFQTIEANAIRNAVSPQQAYTSATQLVSSGMKPEVAAGGGVNEFLRGLGAMNARGIQTDQRALAEAVVSYLNSQNIELTPDNIRNSMQRSQRLFMGTNFQAPDLGELSKKGSALRTAISPEEQFAGMSVFRDVGLPGSEAATALANITGRLQTAAASKDKTAALQRIGLKPDDVDFIGKGENLGAVVGKVRDGLQKIREQDRASILKVLFEEAGVPQFQALAGNLPKLQTALDVQQQAAEYQADVDQSLQGRGAALQRVKSEQLLIDADRGRREGLDKVARISTSNELKERGTSDLLRNIAVDGQIPLVSQFTGPMSVYDLMRSMPFGLSADPDRAANWAATTGTMFLGDHQAAQHQVSRRIQAAEGGELRPAAETIRVPMVGPSSPDAAVREQSDLMRESNDLAREQLKEMRQRPQPSDPRPDVRPPGALNSQLNDDRVNSSRP